MRDPSSVYARVARDASSGHIKWLVRHALQHKREVRRMVRSGFPANDSC